MPAPGGRLLAYNSADGARPVIRLLDLDTDGDTVLDEGAVSAAWRGDGAVAYFKALRPELGDPREYHGQLVVRAAPEAPPVRWTETPARYVAAAWAGERLLAYRLGGGPPVLLVLDGPGRARELGRVGLIAVGPEGDRIVVTGFGAAPPRLAVLDVASGRELAGGSFAELGWVAEAGSWRGELVVAATRDGIAVFRAGERSLELVETIALRGERVPSSVSEPQLAGDRRIVAWGEVESRAGQAFPDAALVECDRVEGRCRPLATQSSTVTLRPVYDPSRP